MPTSKPGLGPSLLGGVGGIVTVVFGVIWMFTALTWEAPLIAPFGMVFVIMGFWGVAYAFRRR